MNKNLLKLEYNKITENLSKYCTTYIGKNICNTLIPETKQSKVQYLLNQTNEASSLLSRFGSAPISDIPNIDIWIKTLESDISLSPKALLDIGYILKISRESKNYFYSENPELFCNTTFPIMSTIFEQLYSNPGIEKTIFNSIIDENTIADDASKTLYNLRKNRKTLESNIKDKLNNFIHSSSYSKFIMEPIITIRNDRYVIPIKVEYKDNIKGLIYDMSFSGSTVYIEPVSIFDMNNQINNIKSEEKIEIEKILEDLSNQIVPIIDNLRTNIECIGKIDFCFAKAKYSNDLHGVCPIINSDKQINLIQARHPLIAKNIVVPISVNLGNNFNSLIITGPNTGGKTVTLKTVGLLCLMASSGLHIPAKENSSIFIFDKIFADIGDEQSIAESLSTFSSHMLNIIDILKSATYNSLILVDELGSGTDPVQGASLAISILEHFNNIGALTMATTHYSEIKNFALLTPGFENASSEFDIENLKPTYRLIIGVPGKSNAFAISKRLGLSDEILNRAEDFLTTDTLNLEELLKNIYDNKLAIDKEKEEILKNSNQIELLRKSLEKDSLILHSKENEIIENAKLKAKNILLDAKQEADDIIKDLNKMYDESELKITSNCNDTSIKNYLKDANSTRNNLNSKLKALSNNLQFDNSTAEDNSYLAISDVSIGMEVTVSGFSTAGKLLTHPNKSGDVQVLIGNAKINTNINKLQKVNTKANQNKSKPIHSSSSISVGTKSKSLSPEINVIGQTVDEAILIIDKYLDDCSMSNLPNIRIVHGKGTGKLRNGIHTFLKSNPHVKSFRLGTFGEGEMGVTIVELK